jgi:hypothetical protein
LRNRIYFINQKEDTFVQLKKILTILLALLTVFAAFAPASFAATGGGVFYVDEVDIDPDKTDETDETDETGNQGGSGSDTGTTEKADPTKDGRYYVHIDLWNASVNQASMGNVAFNFSPNGLLITESGKYRLQVGTRPVEVSGYTTAITAVAGVDVSVSVVKTGSFTTNTKFDGEAHSLSTVRVFELPLSNVTTEYIPIKFKVPYTPMDAVGAATDGWLSARLKIDWSSVTAAGSSAELNPPTTITTGSSSLDATASAPAASLADSATGIKLTAAAGVVPTDAELSITTITSGTDFTKAETAIKTTLATEETLKFKLYDISLIQSKVAIQPNGTITLSIPIPSDYDKAKVVFYRINDDGTATLIKGKVSGDNYEVSLSRLSLYALIEGLEDVNDLTAAGDISKFTDITGHWAYESIKFAVENGLFNGTSETTFSPNVAMDRGMFVTVLGRIAGINAADYTATPFTDVKAGAYYASYAAWASENGIVEGVGGGLFAPANPITRQEMATMLNRYVGFAKITLASAAKDPFADDASIASWAKDSVYALAFADILNGVGDNNYAPAKTATRAEVATMLTRFVQGYIQ